MPPNSVEPYVVEANDNTNGNKCQSPTPGEVENNGDNYYLKIVQSSLNLLAHTLIGIVVGISIIFSFRFGMPLGSMPLHVVLCVIGVSISHFSTTSFIASSIATTSNENVGIFLISFK